MTTELLIPEHQPTSVGTMLKEEFLEPIKISQGELANVIEGSRKCPDD